MRFSPYAMTDYGLQHGSGVVLPFQLNTSDSSAEAEARWNVYWASIPEIDAFLDIRWEDFDGFRALTKSFPYSRTTQADNLLRVCPGLGGDITPAEASAMLSQHPQIIRTVVRDDPQKWLETTIGRLQLAQSLVDVSDAAALCKSIVQVDFRAGRRQ